MTQYRDISAAASAFPWPTPQKLHEDLKSGKLHVGPVMSQFSAITRENLKVIEDFVIEKENIEKDLRNKCDKMDALIRDLGEKCQGLQQALLYKEEKYDEKCREVERYKVICELNSKAAINDDIYFHPEYEENNNLDSYGDTGSQRAATAEDPEDRETRARDYGKGSQERDLNNNLIMSCGYADRQTGAFQHLKIPTRKPTTIEHEEFNKRPERSGYAETPDDRRASIKPDASQYVGGPVKRLRVELPDRELLLQDRMSMIGGINVAGPRTNKGPVPIKQIFKVNETPSTSAQRDGSSISMVAQRNQVMSSTGAAVQLTKRKFTEKELHKQVAQGSWTRLASRRKKTWPF